VSVVSLRRFPKCIPGETNSLSMCERIKKLEQRMEITEESLSENVSKLNQIEDKVNNFASYSAIARGNSGSGKQASSNIQNETIYTTRIIYSYNIARIKCVRVAMARIIATRILNAINADGQNLIPAHELIMVVPSMELVYQVRIYLCIEFKRTPLLIA